MENKNGQGIFYGVIGVATLIVAIIGATFAYFSASTTTNYTNNIAGGTNDSLSGALSLTVSRVVFYQGTTATSGDGLIPADMDEDTATDIQNALGQDCVDDGYTGCHVYKITARSNTDLAAATITLDDLAYTASANGKAANKTDWKYSIFTTGASTASATTGLDLTTTAFSSSNVVSIVNHGEMDVSSAQTIHSTGMTANTDYVYYLMVFLKDDDPTHSGTAAQNDTSANDATGTYAGHVSMVGGTDGGKLTATFTAGV